MRELAEWRLAEYLDRPDTTIPGGASADIECKVSHAGGRPILFLPSRDERSDIPTGWTDVVADTVAYEASFQKVAVNVLRKTGSDDNELPGLLRRWFGPDAGRPGTAHRIVFERRGEVVYLAPLGRRSSALEVWRPYSREEIPGQHADRGIAVHLFVRAESKTAHGRAAPFVYCGDVDFVTWKGDQPITVTWRLREGMPARVWKTLGGAAGRAQ